MKIILGFQFAALLFAEAVAFPYEVPGGDDGNGGNHWALLVAGSNTWDNYRHQADICHAYHIISKNGIPDERIIVMMYDDIAHNSENPIKGNIINEPNGTNVYTGVPKDYTNDEVTPEVFLKVLTGDAEGVQKTLGRPGKVIKSGPKDRIFVNFADHGAAGLLGFPTDVLHVEDLHKAIKQMYKTKMYKQLVFYVEACESGSMFNKFSQKMADMSVFVTTAANPDESSYACYFDDYRQVYLGDVYSVKWMEDSDWEDLTRETLKKQFELVRSETNTSHVMEYGDLTISGLPVADFQGTLNTAPLYFTPEKRKRPNPLIDAVPSEAVPLMTLKHKMAMTNGAEREKHRASLQRMYQRKEASENFFKMVVSGVQTQASYEYLLDMPLDFTDYKCYRESVRLIMDLCPRMNLPQNDFALRKLRVLANLCEVNIPAEEIWHVIGHVAMGSEICVY